MRNHQIVELQLRWKTPWILNLNTVFENRYLHAFFAGIIPVRNGIDDGLCNGSSWYLVFGGNLITCFAGAC